MGDNRILIILLMVFRIRDKSLFWTKSGWKNNWEPKILNMPKPINPATTQYVIMRNDYHSFLRSINSSTQSSRPIVTSPEPAANISTATLSSSSSSCLSCATSSDCPSTARPQSNSSRTDQYPSRHSGTQICRPDRQGLRVAQSQLPPPATVHLRTGQQTNSKAK